MGEKIMDGAGFEGRVALVTGGGSIKNGIGNGRATAILLARAGAKVMVADITRERAMETAELIRAEGGIAEVVQANVTDPDQCAKMIEFTVQRFGRLDFLDNNVGVTVSGNVVELEIDDWRRIMQTNVESMFLVSKYAIPAMIATASGGAIVNISSVAALHPSGRAAYTASKGAIISLTRSMALDHGKDGIRVNCVIPGGVYTPMSAEFAVGGPLTDDERDRRRQFSVLGIEGDGWDTAYAVRFLLSEHARFISGQSLIVDGGTTVPDARMRRDYIPARNTA